MGNNQLSSRTKKWNRRSRARRAYLRQKENKRDTMAEHILIQRAKSIQNGVQPGPPALRTGVLPSEPSGHNPGQQELAVLREVGLLNDAPLESPNIDQRFNTVQQTSNNICDPELQNTQNINITEVISNVSENSNSQEEASVSAAIEKENDISPIAESYNENSNIALLVSNNDSSTVSENTNTTSLISAVPQHTASSLTENTNTNSLISAIPRNTDSSQAAVISVAVKDNILQIANSSVESSSKIISNNSPYFQKITISNAKLYSSKVSYGRSSSAAVRGNIQDSNKPHVTLNNLPSISNNHSSTPNDKPSVLPVFSVESSSKIISNNSPYFQKITISNAKLYSSKVSYGRSSSAAVRGNIQDSNKPHVTLNNLPSISNNHSSTSNDKPSVLPVFSIPIKDTILTQKNSSTHSVAPQLNFANAESSKTNTTEKKIPNCTIDSTGTKARSVKPLPKEITIKGRRIIDFEYFFRTLKYVNNHSTFDCNLNDIIITHESKRGICTAYKLRCTKCDFEKKIWSENPYKKYYNLNREFVSGVLSINCSFEAANKLLATVQLPTITLSDFAKEYDEILSDGTDCIKPHQDNSEKNTQMKPQKITVQPPISSTSNSRNLSKQIEVDKVTDFTKECDKILSDRRDCMRIYQNTSEKNAQLKPQKITVQLPISFTSNSRNLSKQIKVDKMTDFTKECDKILSHRRDCMRIYQNTSEKNTQLKPQKITVQPPISSTSNSRNLSKQIEEDKVTNFTKECDKILSDRGDCVRIYQNTSEKNAQLKPQKITVQLPISFTSNSRNLSKQIKVDKMTDFTKECDKILSHRRDCMRIYQNTSEKNTQLKPQKITVQPPISSTSNSRNLSKQIEEDKVTNFTKECDKILSDRGDCVRIYQNTSEKNAQMKPQNITVQPPVSIASDNKSLHKQVEVSKVNVFTRECDKILSGKTDCMRIYQNISEKNAQIKPQKITVQPPVSSASDNRSLPNQVEVNNFVVDQIEIKEEKNSEDESERETILSSSLVRMPDDYLTDGQEHETLNVATVKQEIISDSDDEPISSVINEAETPNNERLMENDIQTRTISCHQKEITACENNKNIEKLVNPKQSSVIGNFQDNILVKSESVMQITETKNVIDSHPGEEFSLKNSGMLSNIEKVVDDKLTKEKYFDRGTTQKKSINSSCETEAGSATTDQQISFGVNKERVKSLSRVTHPENPQEIPAAKKRKKFKSRPSGHEIASSNISGRSITTTLPATADHKNILIPKQHIPTSNENGTLIAPQILHNAGSAATQVNASSTSGTAYMPGAPVVIQQPVNIPNVVLNVHGSAYVQLPSGVVQKLPNPSDIRPSLASTQLSTSQNAASPRWIGRSNMNNNDPFHTLPGGAPKGASDPSPPKSNSNQPSHQSKRPRFRCDDCDINFAKYESLESHKRLYCIKRLKFSPSSTITNHSSMFINHASVSNAINFACEPPSSEANCEELLSAMAVKRSLLETSMKSALDAQYIINLHKTAQDLTQKTFKELDNALIREKALMPEASLEEQQAVSEARAQALIRAEAAYKQEKYSAAAVEQALYRQKTAIEATVAATVLEQNALISTLRGLNVQENQSDISSTFKSQCYNPCDETNFIQEKSISSLTQTEEQQEVADSKISLKSVPVHKISLCNPEFFIGEKNEIGVCSDGIALQSTSHIDIQPESVNTTDLKCEKEIIKNISSDDCL